MLFTMKNTLILLALLALSCSKPQETAAVGFQAAYQSSVCMESNPSYVVIAFDGFTKTLPVKEIREGVLSLDTFDLDYGEYEVLSIEVFNEDDKKVSSVKTVRDSDLVVNTVPFTQKINGDTKIYSQLFCN